MIQEILVMDDLEVRVGVGLLCRAAVSRSHPRLHYENDQCSRRVVHQDMVISRANPAHTATIQYICEGFKSHISANCLPTDSIIIGIRRAVDNSKHDH